MLKLFGRLIKNTSEDVSTSEITSETINEAPSKEEETMAKAKESKATEINVATKEETVMKKETTKETKGKATKNTKGDKTMSKAKTTAKTSKAKETKTTKAKAKGEAMKEVTITINGIQITCTEEQAMAIMVACASNGATTEPTAKETKKTSASKTKETAKKSNNGNASKGKKNAPTKAKETATETKTWTEKKEEWAKENFSEEERTAYGKQKSDDRLRSWAKRFAYANTKFEERVAKEKWNEAYNKNLEVVMALTESIINDGTVYAKAKDELAMSFLATVKRIEEVKSDKRGYKKFAVA